MTRRELLAAAGGLLALAAGFWPRRAAAARLRPPGALPPGAFERACIRCFRCAEVCPPRAIRFDSALDPRASDTPWIDAADRACILCMKCTDVCPTGALLPIPPDRATVHARVHMGTPVLYTTRCIPWSGRGVCRLCYYACPFPDDAIKLAGARQRPVFRATACVGCGLCEEACPSDVRAIHIAPLPAPAPPPPATPERA